MDPYATSVAVSGTDVYVAGIKGVIYTQSVVYWKNGNLVNLSDLNPNLHRYSFRGDPQFLIIQS